MKPCATRAVPILSVLTLGMLLPNPAAAQPHLGMKLACKRYADAWNSGSLKRLEAAVTEDFARQWRRVPKESFDLLPRGGAGSVLNTRRGSRQGTVRAMTADGPVTFELVGSGFDWLVDDLVRVGDDGRPVSTKEYMDVSLTAGEFIGRLKEQGGDAFHSSLTQDFRRAFAKLPADALDRIRAFLPDPAADARRSVVIRGRYATMKVRLPGGAADEIIRFDLRKERGWRVDDYRVQTRAVDIPSFKKALPGLAKLIEFNEFTTDPDPRAVRGLVVPGDLCEGLCHAALHTPERLESSGRRRRLTIGPKGLTVQADYSGRSMRIILCDERQCRIETIHVTLEDRWVPVGRLLRLQRQLADSTALVGSLLQRLTAAAEPTDAEESMLTAVAAKLPVEWFAADDEPVTVTIPTLAIPDPAIAAVTPVPATPPRAAQPQRMEVAVLPDLARKAPQLPPAGTGSWTH